MTYEVNGIIRKMQEVGKKKLMVFLVDDDQLYLKAISHQLNSIFGKSIEVFSFKNGEECLTSLHLNPDLVLVDHYLNDSDQQDTGLICYRRLSVCLIK